MAIQDFKSGGTPFPYATDCTVFNGTCDPANLVSMMDFPELADPIDLSIGPTADDSDAVKLVGW